MENYPKKILLLGGSYAQMPIIKEAKRQGLYVITCDYLPENPGHKLADEYYNVSTTDKDAVLNLAIKLKPDIVYAYASDPAAPVASYVTEKLGLTGNPYNCVRILTEKDLFRNLLKNQGLNCPKNVTVNDHKNAFEKIRDLSFPIIVKPTDSSGSKGVTLIKRPNQISDAIKYAFKFSRSKRAILEEYIDNSNGDLHGDGFVLDGKLVFCCLGDHLYSSGFNPFNPCGTLWPTGLSESNIDTVKKDVEKIISASGFKFGPLNIEARINKDGKPYIMEIGPRNGGHFVPQAIQYATGFDMVKAIIDILCNKEINIPYELSLFSAYYALHSDIPGVLNKITFSEELTPYIKEFHQYRFPGDKINLFSGSNEALGILLLQFKTRKEMDSVMSGIKQMLSVEII